MKVTVHKVSDNWQSVVHPRLGEVGTIRAPWQKPSKFRYNHRWMELTYDENTAVLAAVEPIVTLLNITKRLTG